MWKAAHDGPHGMRGAAVFAAWTGAANWLAAMLRVVQPTEGYRDACRALARTFQCAC